MDHQLPWGEGCGLALSDLPWWNSDQWEGGGAWGWLCVHLGSLRAAVTGAVCTGQVTEEVAWDAFDAKLGPNLLVLRSKQLCVIPGFSGPQAGSEEAPAGAQVCSSGVQRPWGAWPPLWTQHIKYHLRDRPSPPGALSRPSVVWEQGSLWRGLGCAQLLPTPHALCRPTRRGVLLLTQSWVRVAPKWARRPGVSTASSLGGRGPRTPHTQRVPKWLLGSHLPLTPTEPERFAKFKSDSRGTALVLHPAWLLQSFRSLPLAASLFLFFSFF